MRKPLTIAAVWIAAVFAVGVAVLGVPPPAAAAAVQSQSVYSLAFNDAEIRQVADEVLGGALGLSYDIDPAISGRMSFRIQDRLTREQLLSAFEAALSVHGVVIVRDGPRLRLLPRERARGAAAVRSADAATRGGYELVAVPLAYATPTEVAAAFQAIGPANLIVHTDDRLGLIVLGGSAREIEQAFQTLRLFDQSALAQSRIRWFDLQNASAGTVGQELEQVLRASGTSGVTVVPLRRLNGLIVFARSPQALEEVGGWVGRLDTPSREEASALWVYRPRNVAAANLAQTLNSVLATTGGTAQEGGEGPLQVQAPAPAEGGVRVGVDRDSNALLISAPASRWVQIQRILAEIDRTPDQILIEATILEVTLGNEFRLGVDWSVMNEDGLTVTSSGATSGAVAGRFPGLAITYLGGDVRAAINALGSRTDVEVISAPKIMALDNRTASLQVGDQVPIVTQAARGTDNPGAPLVVTTEYRNTGVLLDVTPRINGENRVLLEISQEVSSVARTTTSGIDSPTIQQRRLESTLILEDGGTVALGGLISSTRSNGRSGVPLLSEIPGVGSLFRSDTRDHRRTELIVLLTVRIIRDDATAQQTIGDLLADMREMEARGLFAPR